jgi:hypothetical protein
MSPSSLADSSITATRSTCSIPAEGGAVMKHQHRPILYFVVIALLGILAIGGGPVVFMLLLMASPLIAIMIFGASLLRNSRHDPHRVPVPSGTPRS